MKFRKTEIAKCTVVYNKGKRVARFEKGECETDDNAVIECLTKMGYQGIGKPKSKNVKKD